MKECQAICKDLGIPDEFLVQTTKQEYKEIVKEACRLKNEKELKENIFKKTDSGRGRLSKKVLHRENCPVGGKNSFPAQNENYKKYMKL